MIGIAIEGAAQEQENTGSDDKPVWKLKYTMQQLLDPEFKLPTEDSWGIEEIKITEGIIYDEVN